eukprot:353505-Chlamydomonas_euryale.AAC.6
MQCKAMHLSRRPLSATSFIRHPVMNWLQQAQRRSKDIREYQDIRDIRERQADHRQECPFGKDPYTLPAYAALIEPADGVCTSLSLKRLVCVLD